MCRRHGMPPRVGEGPAWQAAATTRVAYLAAVLAPTVRLPQVHAHRTATSKQPPQPCAYRPSGPAQQNPRSESCTPPILPTNCGIPARTCPLYGPHLLFTHGDESRGYAACVGRFLPGSATSPNNMAACRRRHRTTSDGSWPHRETVTPATTPALPGQAGHRWSCVVSGFGSVRRDASAHTRSNDRRRAHPPRPSVTRLLLL